MQTWWFSVAILALVAFAPGILVHRIITPARIGLEAVAVAPVLTAATLYLVFRAGDLVSIRFEPAAFVALVAVLGVAALVRRRAGPPRPAPVESDERRPRARRWLGGAAVAASIGIGLLTWANGVPNDRFVPPNHDSMNHGFIAARIVDTASLRPDRVLVTHPQTDQAVVDFYPLGVHSIAAIVHRITGAELSDVLWWIAIGAGAVCFPLGIYVLTRRLYGPDPLVTGSAAVLSVLVPLFPYKPIAWGGIALIAGLSLAPAAAVAVVECGRARSVLPASLLGALVLVGLLVVHTSEVPYVILLGGFMVLHGARAMPPVRTMLPRFALMGFLFSLVAVPVALQLSDARSAVGEPPTNDLAGSIADLASLRVSTYVPQGRLMVAVAAGVVVLLVRRRPWMIAGLGLLVGLYAIAAVSEAGALRALTSPWYEQAERLAYNVVPVAVVIGAVGVAGVARALSSAVRGGAARSAVAMIMTGAAVYAIGAGIPPRTASMLEGEVVAYSPIGPPEVEAFRFLSRHSGPNLAVLSDELGDGSLWMYAFEGVDPVFAIKPASYSRLWTSWEERLFLIAHLTDPETAGTVDRLLAKYCVGFVYYGERRLYGAAKHLDLAALESDPRLEAAFGSPGVRVFRVREPRCAPTARDPA